MMEEAEKLILRAGRRPSRTCICLPRASSSNATMQAIFLKIFALSQLLIAISSPYYLSILVSLIDLDTNETISPTHTPGPLSGAPARPGCLTTVLPDLGWVVGGSLRLYSMSGIFR